jgi:hypothetical protein
MLHEDGGLNPPHFYITHNEVQNALHAATCQPGPTLDVQHIVNNRPALAIHQGAETATATVVAPTAIVPLVVTHGHTFGSCPR